MRNSRNWWNKHKIKLALVPALIFWTVSMLCFIFGLSFQNLIGITFIGLDISMWIAIGLSLGNTIIQIIGNEQTKEKMGSVLYWGWLSSYILGIGSNVNALIGILHLGNPILEWTVCVSLGSMIEILPEYLVVAFLKSFDEEPVQRQNQSKNSYHSVPQSIPRKDNGKPVYAVDMIRGIQQENEEEFPRPMRQKREVQEPTYHPISYRKSTEGKK